MVACVGVWRFNLVAGQLIVRALLRRRSSDASTANKTGAGEGLGWEAAKQAPADSG